MDPRYVDIYISLYLSAVKSLRSCFIDCLFGLFINYLVFFSVLYILTQRPCFKAFPFNLNVTLHTFVPPVGFFVPRSTISWFVKCFYCRLPVPPTILLHIAFPLPSAFQNLRLKSCAGRSFVFHPSVSTTWSFKPYCGLFSPLSS